MNLKSLWHRAIVTDCNSMASLFVGLLPILVLFLLGGSSQVLASGVTDLRVGSHENYVRIVIQLNSESAYTIQREEGGKVVVLSLDADSGTEILKSLPAPLGSVKISPSGKGSKVRIELLRRGVRLKEMVLMGPPRIVLDFFPPSQGAPADAGVIPTPAPATARPAPSKVTAAPAPVPPKESKPAAISWPVDEGSVPAAESASSQANDAPEKFTSWGSEVPGPEAAVDDFDHFRTRFPLMGGHERVSCEKCHVGGGFQGTPVRCAVCHDGSGILSDSGKDVRHIRTTNECGDCHLQVAWVPSRVDHAAVIGGCADCHNGLGAPGKPPSHPQSSNLCEDCHRSMTWLGARFDHSNLTGSCFSCHNGVSATGKPMSHIQSSNLCEDCHSPGSWSNARFNHAGVSGNCFGCHNGVDATGKSPNHVQSSNTCEDCHSPGSWLNAQFNHAGVSGNCFGCHNGVDATGKSPNHVQSSNTCEDCHSPGSWLNVQFDHSQVMGDCGSCHTSDFKRDAHKKVDSPAIFYSASELRDCTGACHMYADPSFTTIVKRRSGEHSIPPGEW